MTHIDHSGRRERIGGEQVGRTGREPALRLFGVIPCQSQTARPLLLVSGSGNGSPFLRIREEVSEGAGLQDVSDADFGCDGV